MLALDRAGRSSSWEQAASQLESLALERWTLVDSEPLEELLDLYGD